MSQENVELVRAGYEAFNRRDFDAALALAHDSISWRTLFSVETDVLRGKQEIRAGWERQIEALDVHIDVVELTPLDETRVLAVGKWRGSGRKAAPRSSRLRSKCSPLRMAGFAASRHTQAGTAP
jgi:ketosteroid isomerase-like protein